MQFETQPHNRQEEKRRLDEIFIYLAYITSNRLDFEAFSIAGPNTQTVCATDNFRVSGTANRVPIICGQNIGQHSKLIFDVILWREREGGYSITFTRQIRF